MMRRGSSRKELFVSRKKLPKQLPDGCFSTFQEKHHLMTFTTPLMGPEQPSVWAGSQRINA